MEESTDQFYRQVTAAMSSGDEDAYRRFYEVCFDRIFRHLLVKTRGNEPLARELSQMVLLRVVRYIRPFDHARVFWAWLYQICRSVHVDWLRRTAKDVGRLEGWIGPDVDESGLDEELLSLLENSIATLDPSDQELLKLAYFEELPQREIAARIQTTPKAIESKLARTRQKLRQLLLEKLKEYALF